MCKCPLLCVRQKSQEKMSRVCIGEPSRCSVDGKVAAQLFISVAQKACTHFLSTEVLLAMEQIVACRANMTSATFSSQEKTLWPLWCRVIAHSRMLKIKISGGWRVYTVKYFWSHGLSCILIKFMSSRTGMRTREWREQQRHYEFAVLTKKPSLGVGVRERGLKLLMAVAWVRYRRKLFRIGIYRLICFLVILLRQLLKCLKFYLGPRRCQRAIA